LCRRRLLQIMTPMSSEPADKKLYKIGDVCKLADVQPYVLRYWETEFAPLAPSKSGGGQRLYTRREVDIVLRIKELLYKEGFTISGAKKKLDVELAQPEVAAAVTSSEAASASPAMQDESPLREKLDEVKHELRELLDILER
jgi:DNA-binding transcriptional MerR regulator